MLSDRPFRSGRGGELLIAIVAALAAGGAGGYLVATRGGGTAGANPGSAPPRADRVTALGKLQPAGNVIPVFGPPGDRILEMRSINPGDRLDVGAPIAELASRKDRQLELQVAETQQAEAAESLRLAKLTGEKRLQAATAELNQARANKGSDLAALDARLAYLRVQSDTAAAGVARLEKLRASGVAVPEENLEKAKLLAAQGEAELKASEAAKKKTETSYVEAEKAAEAKEAAARAELAEAVARVPTRSSAEKIKLANQLAEQTVLKAPIAGTVLKVIGRDGQPTGIEPVLQMADLTAMTAVAEVYENDIERLSRWVQAAPVKAEVKHPALPRTLTGVVRSPQDISRMISRNQVFAMGPREDADRRVIEVVVHVDAKFTEDAGRFVGLQVTVTLEPGK